MPYPAARLPAYKKISGATFKSLRKVLFAFFFSLGIFKNLNAVFDIIVNADPVFVTLFVKSAVGEIVAALEILAEPFCEYLGTVVVYMTVIIEVLLSVVFAVKVAHEI